jgi:mycothiol synthase
LLGRCAKSSAGIDHEAHMTAQVHEIRPFNLRSASPRDYACLIAFKNNLRLEVHPEDPPFPCDEDIQRWQAMPKLVQDVAWAAWDAWQERIIAFGEADIYHTGDNPHVIECSIEVLPECRRQGLARGMLHLIADHARSQQRRLLLAELSDRVPANFLARIGARKGLELPINQMQVANIDRSVVARWIQQAESLSSEFALGLWDEAYSEESIGGVSDLLQVVANDQPRDALDMEDINYTPETVRQFDRHQRAASQQRWTMYLMDKRDDRLAGITEVIWSPNRPAILEQGFTGVLPEYRSRGLGRWLKAVMLEKILRERPEVQVIRSNNANSNAPMLKINRALGFEPYVGMAVWQVELVSVEKYLARHT